VSKLQSVHDALKQEQRRVEEGKKQFVQQANNQLESYTQAAVKTLEPIHQAFEKNLSKLRVELGSIPGGKPKDLSPKRFEEPSPLSPDEDGLNQIPDDPVAFVGGRLGLVDFGRSEGGGAAIDAEAAASKLEENQNKAREAMDKLVGLKAKCLDEKVTALSTTAEKLLECSVVKDSCDQQALAKVRGDAQDILAALAGVSESLGLDVMSNLETGISGLCSKSEATGEKTATSCLALARTALKQAKGVVKAAGGSTARDAD
jgi:hypothetical protein